LLLVGFESGNQKILDGVNKGIKLEVARKFMENCHKLGIKVHGAFILGLPNESQETIEETIRFACEVNPHTIQVSIASPIQEQNYILKQRKMVGLLETL
jgi:Fe-S oxidoreductase